MQPGTQQGIVDTQRALLVVAKDKSRTELLIERADGQVCILAMSFDIKIGHTPTGIVGRDSQESGHGMLQIFKAQTGIQMVAGKIYLGKGVGERPLTVILSTYLAVALREDNVTLYASAQVNLVLRFLLRQ